MKKIGKILAISLTGALLLSGTLVVSACDYQGETPGFWKNMPKRYDYWVDAGYTPDMLVGDIFTIPGYLSHFADDTLLQALRYNGGGGTAEGMAMKLLRSAVAGLLNAGHPDVNYIYRYSDILWLVNYGLSTGNPSLMEYYKDLIDAQNNLGSNL